MAKSHRNESYYWIRRHIVSEAGSAWGRPEIARYREPGRFYIVGTTMYYLPGECRVLRRVPNYRGPGRG